MDTTAVHPDDVSALDESTALGVRDWASGARPVLGTLAASILLVLVCGLFVIDAGSLGRRHDVGQRQPVQMLPRQLRHDQAQAPAPAQSTTVRARATRRSQLPAVDKPVRTVHVDQAPGAGSAVTPTPRGDAAKPAPTQAPPPTPVAPTQPSAPTTITPQLPAPLDELPVPAPPAVPTVVLPSAPAVPPLPDVSITTANIGVP
jgi:hypothetical protein